MIIIIAKTVSELTIKGHCSVLESVVTRAVATKGGLPQSGSRFA